MALRFGARAGVDYLYEYVRNRTQFNDTSLSGDLLTNALFNNVTEFLARVDRRLARVEALKLSRISKVRRVVTQPVADMAQRKLDELEPKSVFEWVVYSCCEKTV